MSSLRVETLRLCWLEAFIEVATEENISKAAGTLGFDQSTVSRYIQSLEKWLGKKLIAPGTVTDPDDARISIGLTNEGQEFFDIADGVVKGLQGFRDETARRNEIMDEISGILSKMQSDLQNKSGLNVTENDRNHIEFFHNYFNKLNNLHHLGAEIPIKGILHFYRIIMKFFESYERSRKKEKRWRKPATPPPIIPKERFEQQRQPPASDAG